MKAPGGDAAHERDRGAGNSRDNDERLFSSFSFWVLFCRCLAASFCSCLPPACFPRAPRESLALLCCLPALVAVAATFVRVHQGRPYRFSTRCPWDGPLAMVLHVDALSLMFAAMGTGLGSIVLLYSIGYMAHDRSATPLLCLHAHLYLRHGGLGL